MRFSSIATAIAATGPLLAAGRPTTDGISGHIAASSGMLEDLTGFSITESKALAPEPKKDCQGYIAAHLEVNTKAYKASNWGGAVKKALDAAGCGKILDQAFLATMVDKATSTGENQQTYKIIWLYQRVCPAAKVMEALKRAGWDKHVILVCLDQGREGEMVAGDIVKLPPAKP